MFNRRVGLLPALFAMAAFAAARMPGLDMARASFVRAEKRARQRARYAATRNRYAHLSGAGARECARRIGGTRWQEWKAGDRVRRGLPAEV